MFRNAACLAICLVATGASAQQAALVAAPSASETPTAQTVVRMEEPLPGDHWTYEVQDEITGKITATQEHVVTEVTPTAISVRFRKLGASNNQDGFAVYDRSWNRVETAPWKYKPNDGSGIEAPLVVGKTWPVRTNNINGANGAVWRRSGISRVVAEESVTTKAGTFDTFKIETTFTGTNVNNPTLKNEVTETTWYAPSIDHWARRTFVSRANRHLRINNAFELTEYGRQQQ